MVSEAESAFAALYGRYEPQIYAYCRRRFAADLAEDVLADVFLTAWRKIDSAPSGEQGLRWLYRIAYLIACNHRRGFTRRSKLVAKLESTGVTFEPPVVDQVVVRDEVRGALALLDGLRPDDREIIRLSVWEHLSIEEISEVLSISPGAATQRLLVPGNAWHETMKGRTETTCPPLLWKEVSGERRRSCDCPHRRRQPNSGSERVGP